jgi:caffeoyl-CoA O-methyltransferase
MMQHDSQMENYCMEFSKTMPEFMAQLERETHLKTTQPRMLSGSIQGAYLKFIAELISARYVVEVGTFTGYSALCMAMGMPSDGRLITLEVDEEMRYFHDKYFSKSGEKNKIHVMYGDAMNSLDSVESGIDLAFIDADKKNYLAYYEKLLPKMRQGGLILADNVLWSGKVYNPEEQDKNTVALREFNQRVTADQRVDNFLLYIRDGLMMIRKR